MTTLHGCLAKNGSEIDGREFDVNSFETLGQIFEIARNEQKQVHLNYILTDDNRDVDLDLWIKVT